MAIIETDGYLKDYSKKMLFGVNNSTYMTTWRRSLKFAAQSSTTSNIYIV